MEFERKRLTPVDLGAGVLIDAVRSTLPGGQSYCFFKSGLAENDIESTDSFPVDTVRSIGGGLLVAGSVVPEIDRIAVPLRGCDREVALPFDESALFAGLNTAVVVRNGDSPQMVLDWLDYHCSEHGLQGLLLIDRVPQDGGAELDAALVDADIDGLERVLVLEPGMPTGRAGMGPEAHIIYAPDAPGKDRLSAPDPDPWRAHFAEFVLYELVRHRFLGRARAVTNIDFSDLLAPHLGASVFDRAAAAASGLIGLTGCRIYPWSLRKGAQPRFGDHICRQFDKPFGNPRWCVAPGRLPATAVWRLIRVVGADPEPGPPSLYYRCVAMRHPNEKIGALVPKTALIEDDVLLELATARMGGDPVRAPAEVLKPAASASGRRTGIVTTMKNEGPFILEWIAYHRAIGIDDFLIYTNDCTDGTDTMLELLQKKGLVQHRDNPFQKMGLKPQHAALQSAEAEPWLANLDWVVCMDVDEFIAIHAGDGRIDDLYAAVGDANLISMNWRLFGNADIDAFEDCFITEKFTGCAPEFIRKPHQAWGFKTLSRNIGLFKKLGVHRPKGLKPQLVEEVRWVNGSGKPLPKSMYRNAWRSNPATYGYDLVTLNHYAVRSAESFLVKRDRGRVNHVDRDQGLAYWFRMNNNAETDTAIHRMLPALREEFGRLMGDPEIAAAHNQSVIAHRAKIAELRATSNYSEFFGELTGNRMKLLSRMHRHFGSGVFLAGPQVVPDEVIRADVPEDFFFTVEQREATH